MNKLFLIDGHALVFKMYYAFLGRPMVNSKGVDTSILPACLVGMVVAGVTGYFCIRLLQKIVRSVDASAVGNNEP